ncbi:hypothetical protein GCM10020227_52350 [Streptomyces flavovirens]
MSLRFPSAAVAAASAAVLALVGSALPASAAGPPPPAAPAETGTAAAAVLTSAQLSVAVARDFPRVLTYTDRAGGARLTGSTRPVTAVTLNGTAHPVKLKGAPAFTASTARYTLVFDDLPGVEIDASLSVTGRVTTFRVTGVRDTGAFRVGTIDIPGHDLISVASTDTGAATAFTQLDPDSTRTADVFAKVTDRTPADSSPVGASYALANTGRLAAAVESNSSYDKPSGATGGDDARFWHQARKAEDGSVRVGVWSGRWTYRGEGAPKPESGENLPWAKVVVTPDANGDKAVDWQDGAVAFRSIGVRRRAPRTPRTGSSPTSRSTSPARPPTPSCAPSTTSSGSRWRRTVWASSPCSRATARRATTPPTPTTAATTTSGPAGSRTSTHC